MEFQNDKKAIEAVTSLADVLGISMENPVREALWAGVIDGQEQGPELSSGMTFEDPVAQRAYDIGTYLGAAGWAAKQEMDVDFEPAEPR